MFGLKALGISLIISGFGGWGLAGARRMEKRVNVLRDLRLSMAFLEKEITTMFTPLSLALERTAQFCDLPVAHLYNATAACLKRKQGVTMTEAWNEGLGALLHNSDLLKSDIKLLENGGRHLGMSNASEQKKIFSLLQEELKLQEEKARDNLKSSHKLWSYGGFVLGTVVVILLL